MSLASFGAGDFLFLSMLLSHGCRRRSRLLRSGASQFAPEPRLRPATKHGAPSYNDLLQKNADFS